ncbi:uncharacterized protein [Nicotiana sylvestris]|uniref:uncharacterized protein n=1 Tax=Nicotiana sylvestris TaxID=4096 RepID=UPI00388CE765
MAHEGTPQVKRPRGTLLYSQYENFTMKEGETIQEMYTRFTTPTNEHKSLGRIILEEDKVEKILTRVLRVTWESKITAIQESKNIATLKLDDLIGNITAYELRRIVEGADLEEDEMAMLTRDFKKYLMRGKGSSRGATYNKLRVPKKIDQRGLLQVWNRKKEQVHRKKNKGSTKALVAAWGESSDKDSKDEDGDEQTLMDIGESDDEHEFKVKRSSQIWYMDSGCSKHMTGRKNQFLSLEDLK